MTAAAHLGPFDRQPWPTQLVAHVVEAGPVPRVHGYDLAGLVASYGVADLVWLGLRGELPAPHQRAALEVAAMLLAPVGVAEAPAHAAVLARITSASPGATLAIATVALGELVGHELTTLAPWRRWLAEPVGPVPTVALAPAPCADGAALIAWLDGRLCTWFGPGAGLPTSTDAPLGRVAAGYAVLHRLGLDGPLELETVAVWARLPIIAAEAARVRAGDVLGYPARLPDYQYVDGEGTSP
ncbi:MAG: hypothetical protein KA297_19855 [Kofleriaceae bacterium]|nr:hypothetical protein [Kofleriaceae bacterium]